MQLYRLRSLPSLSWTLAWHACLVFTLRLAPASSRPSGSMSRPTSCRTPMTRSTSTVTSISNRYGAQGVLPITPQLHKYSYHCCWKCFTYMRNVENVSPQELTHDTSDAFPVTVHVKINEHQVENTHNKQFSKI